MEEGEDEVYLYCTVWLLYTWHSPIGSEVRQGNLRQCCGIVCLYVHGKKVFLLL